MNIFTRSTALHSCDSLSLILTLSFDFTERDLPHVSKYLYLLCTSAMNTVVKPGTRVKSRSLPTRLSIPSIPDRFIWKVLIPTPEEGFHVPQVASSDPNLRRRSAENDILALCLQPPDERSQSQLPPETYVSLDILYVVSFFHNRDL